MTSSRVALPPNAWHRGSIAFAVVLVATVGQLLLATLAPNLPQFEGKAFGARLVFYPLMMLAPVVVWVAVSRLRGIATVPPWAGSR